MTCSYSFNNPTFCPIKRRHSQEVFEPNRNAGVFFLNNHLHNSSSLLECSNISSCFRFRTSPSFRPINRCERREKTISSMSFADLWMPYSMQMNSN